MHSFNASLLREPWEILKADGQPYRVYTPYWKAVLASGIEQALLPAQVQVPAPETWPSGLEIADLSLLPTIRWDRVMLSGWQVGETAAMQRLHAFMPVAAAYKEDRDFPAHPATSKLSPHLHFGEISPRQAVYIAQQWLAEHPQADRGIPHFLHELG